MTGYRPEVEALVEPGVCEGRADGTPAQLVTLRLFTAPADREITPGGDTFTHLRPSEARELAFSLLACAEHATKITDRGEARWWVAAVSANRR